jgi:hypothetical protein
LNEYKKSPPNSKRKKTSSKKNLSFYVHTYLKVLSNEN